MLAYQFMDPIFISDTSSIAPAPAAFPTTGVDLAQQRDFLMTVDPALGRVPVERLQDAKQNMQSFAARGAQSEEFVEGSWENIPTEVAGRTRSAMFGGGKLWTGSVTGGVWYTEDYSGKAEWQSQPGLENFSPTCMVADPNNPDALYIGSGESFTAVHIYRSSTSRGQGIAKSTDGGNTWTVLEATSDFNFISDLVIRQEEGISVLYAAVASGRYGYQDFNSQDGLYRSADGGETWSLVPLELTSETGFLISDLEVTSNGTLLVGTMRDLSGVGGGYLLSSTNGTDWTVHDEYQDREAKLRELYGSIEAGRTVITSSPSDPDRWYVVYMAAFQNSYQQWREFDIHLMMTPDGGQTWKEITQPEERWSNIPWHAATMAVDPENPNHLTIGALDLFTTDLTPVLDNEIISPEWKQRTSWAVQFQIGAVTPEEEAELIKGWVHADMHFMTFVEGNPDKFIVTTDGGIFFSENFSDAWEAESGGPEFNYSNTNLNTTQYYSVALDPTAGSQKMIGGTQDNGTANHIGNGTPISYGDKLSGGDGAFCFWDQNDAQLRISSVYANRYYVHRDGMNTEFVGYYSGRFINPADYDHKHNWLFANMSDAGDYGFISGFDGAWRDSLLFIDLNPYLGRGYTFGTDTVRTIRARTGTSAPFSAVTASAFGGDSAIVYLGTINGDVFKVTGMPFSPKSTKIDLGALPDGYISSIAEGSSPGQVLVTFSNFGLESVWYTGDDGATWRNLDEGTAGLPDMPVRWSVFDPRDSRRVFIATELGLFSRRLLLDETWTHHTEELPVIRMDMIKVRESDGAMAIATHGNGLYHGYLKPEITTGLESSFTQYSVYPNPAKEQITISGQQMPEMIRVYDLQGRLVLQAPISSEGTVSVGKLTPNNYRMLGLDQQGKILFSKLISKQ
ncbi:MAG TPA: hypothetical protein DCE41_17690 [Cytophagales bacterium]|nr:hypothetical protein [Cytophagales bacterium]HAP62863.1 hypothetical protein [Cytophagales bacterium]